VTFLWVGILLIAVWAAHWGAERLSDPLKKLRKQWGFSVAAGGSFLGLAAASPEIGINTTSAVRGVSDIGVGAMLGSNVLAIPLMVATAYVATRKSDLGGEHKNHGGHRRQRLVAVDRGAVTVQALPYLGILAVFALLTLPAPWRGLQPIDGWILWSGAAARSGWPPPAWARLRSAPTSPSSHPRKSSARSAFHWWSAACSSPRP
jgi:cation:H+ antiporter